MSGGEKDVSKTGQGDRPSSHAPPVDATCDFDPGRNTVRLVEILEAYLDGLKAGQAPGREQLLAQHPEFADQLDACLAGLDFIHGTQQEHAPRQLGDFRIVREIGRGGMGAVYEAEQISLNRRVALKILRFAAVSDPEAIGRFQREAETVARLHHTNIVPIFCVGQERGINFYAMQFIEGQSLADVIAHRRPAPQEVAQWGLESAEALAHAHQRGVIHRDVKPSNLLLDKEGCIWLTDFGLAKRADDVTLSMTGALLGTPRYMSPEQASATNRELDCRTDIYSLGASLYELATGQPVFAGNTPHDVISQILWAEPVPPRRIHASLPRDLETILLRCLAKEPERRYQTAAALADDLRAFLDGRPIQARRTSWYERGMKLMRRQKRSVLTAGIAVAVTGLMVVTAVLGWNWYSQWRLGTVQFTSDPSPAAIELFAAGSTTPLRLTAPTQDPLSLPRGDHLVRASAEGYLSETYRLEVERAWRKDVQLRLRDRLMWSGLSVDAGFDLVQRDAGHDLVTYAASGISLIDGASKQPRWSAPLLPPSHSFFAEYPGLRWQPGVFAATQVLEIRQHLRPNAAPALVDINNDQHADLIVGGSHQAWLMAISGSDGQPLWFAPREEPLRKAQDTSNYGWRTSGLVQPPQWVDDLDADGVRDVLISCVASPHQQESAQPQRWLEIISGAKGTSIWRYDVPLKWSGPEAPERFAWFTGYGGGGWGGSGGWGHDTGSTWVRGRSEISRSGDHVYVQDAPLLISGAEATSVRQKLQPASTAEGDLIAMIAGDRLLLVDQKTGKPLVEPVPLGLRPELPAIWRDLDNDKIPDAILIEHVAGTSVGGSRPQAMHVVAWSPARRGPLWEKTLKTYWPGNIAAHIPAPHWPIVTDLNDDGKYEVLVPNGSSHGPTQAVTDRSPWGGLEALRGEDGHVLWSRRIRNMDGQVDFFAVGPDIDGDRQRDVFAATIWGNYPELFIDAISGGTGEPLAHCRYALRNIAANTGEFFVGHCDYLPTDTAGQERLCVVAYGDPTPTIVTLFFDLRTGKVQSQVVGREPIVVDVDGDGANDVLLHDRGDLENNVATVDCVRGTVPPQWTRLGNTTGLAADFDGDGAPDLLESLGGWHVNAVSLAKGDVLWRTTPAGLGGTKVVPAAPWPQVADKSTGSTLGDLDGDGTTDALAYIDSAIGYGVEKPLLQAISGKTGKRLWDSEAAARNFRSVLRAQAYDVDGDGRDEVVLVTVVARESTNNNEHLWLIVLSGQTGTTKWEQQLSSGNSNMTVLGLQPTDYPFAIADLNADGSLELVVAAPDESQIGAWQLRTYRGKDGTSLWTAPIPVVGTGIGPFSQIAPIAVADLKGDGRKEVLMLSFEQTPPTSAGDPSVFSPPAWTSKLVALSGSDGKPLWTFTRPESSEIIIYTYGDNRGVNWLQVKPLRANGGDRVCLVISPSRNEQVLVVDGHGQLQSKKQVDLAGRTFLDVRPCDADGDKQDEIAFFDANKLQLFSAEQLDKPLWSVNTSFNGRPEITDVWPSSSNSPPTIVLRQPQDTTVVGVSAADGAELWCSTGSVMTQANNTAIAVPPAAKGDKPLVYAAIAGTYQCREAVPTTPSVLRNPVPILSGWDSETVGVDPRFLRPLPWTYFQNDLGWKQIGTFLLTLFKCMVLVLAPAVMLGKLLMRRRVSLRYFLVLPLLLMLWIVVFKFTPSVAPTAKPWAELLNLATFAPACITFLGLTFFLITGRWRPVLRWLGLIVATTIIVGLVMLVVQKEGLEPGERYSLRGAYLLFLPVGYLASYLFCLVLLIKAVRRWRRQRRPTAMAVA